MTDISTLQLPDDHVIDTYRHGRDLYIIYVRTILRIPNYEGGCRKPEEAHTLEMQDYYSYEYPILTTDTDGRLWCYIGGRIFRWEDSKSRWIEMARFHADSLVEVTDSEMVFRNHLQQDENPHGTKTFNYRTCTITQNN